jgi:hypothetical protein
MAIHPLFAKLLAPFAGKPRITTRCLYPPIPMRDFDWCAYREGEEERMQYGYGRTEEAAVAELLKLEDEGFYT